MSADGESTEAPEQPAGIPIGAFVVAALTVQKRAYNMKWPSALVLAIIILSAVGFGVAAQLFNVVPDGSASAGEGIIAFAVVALLWIAFALFLIGVWFALHETRVPMSVDDLDQVLAKLRKFGIAGDGDESTAGEAASSSVEAAAVIEAVGTTATRLDRAKHSTVAFAIALGFAVSAGVTAVAGVANLS